jgi:hypothetical protein
LHAGRFAWDLLPRRFCFRNCMRITLSFGCDWGGWNFPNPVGLRSQSCSLVLFLFRMWAEVSKYLRRADGRHHNYVSYSRLSCATASRVCLGVKWEIAEQPIRLGSALKALALIDSKFKNIQVDMGITLSFGRDLEGWSPADPDGVCSQGAHSVLPGQMGCW